MPADVTPIRRQHYAMLISLFAMMLLIFTLRLLMPAAADAIADA